MVAGCPSIGNGQPWPVPHQNPARQCAVDLSIVIVSYNTRDLLDACLGSVLQDMGEEVQEAQDTPPRLEVIVVDNGSSDGSVEMVRSSYPHVRLLEMGRNTGFARGSNEGIRVSTGRYIMLLNSDTVVQRHALSHIITFLDEHPEWAAAGPRLLNRDGTVQLSCFAFPTVWDIICESLWLMQIFPHFAVFNHLGLGGFDHATTREVDWVSGACLVVRRSVVERVGLLDEGYFMYGEELDWCRRIKQAGLRIVFFPGAEVVHYGRSSSESMRVRIGRLAMSGRLCYFEKYHGARAVCAVRVMTVVGLLLRLLAAPLWCLLRPKSAHSNLRWYWGMFAAVLTTRTTQSWKANS